jgi:hypothetical protein
MLQMNRNPQESKPGDHVPVDPTMADDEVVPLPTEDKDERNKQGRETEEPKEMPMREQLYPNCR